MKVSERYKAFYGQEMLPLLLVYAGVICLNFLPFFHFSVQNNKLNMGYIAYVWMFYSFSKVLYSIFRKEKIEENFNNIKYSYATAMIIMIAFTVLYSVITTFINLWVYKDSVNLMNVVSELEWTLLFYALIPFCLYMPTLRKFSTVFFIVYILYSLKVYILPEPSVTILILLAVIIFAAFFISSFFVLRHIEKRWKIIDNTETTGLQESTLLFDRLDKSYRICTGKSLDFLIRIHVIQNVALFLIRLCFAEEGSFTIINTSIQTAVIVASMGIFSGVMSGYSDFATHKNCYFLTIKNRQKIYKDYYFTTYFSILISLLVFSILTYVAGGLRHILPENFYLNMAADVVSLLLIFAVIPLLFTSKNVAIIMVENMLVSLAFIPVKIFIVKLHWSFLVVGTLIAVMGIIYSNKFWIKRITRLYEEM